MSRQTKNILRTTSEGRLFIASEDFFQQNDVVEMIDNLLNSGIVKHIAVNKPVEKTHNDGIYTSNID